MHTNTPPMDLLTRQQNRFKNYRFVTCLYALPTNMNAMHASSTWVTGSRCAIGYECGTTDYHWLESDPLRMKMVRGVTVNRYKNQQLMFKG